MKRNTNTNNNGIANTSETSNNKDSIINGNTSDIIDRTLKNQKYTNEEDSNHDRLRSYTLCYNMGAGI